MSAKIMLVEDDTNLSDIYRARLEAEGYQIVAAPDGEDALALAVKEHPDLIISDVMMPKISGFDMLDILRSTNGIKDTRVIMMTALSQAEDQARAKKLGADRYLVKSQVTLEDVIKTVHEVLEDEPAETPPEPVSLTPPVPSPSPTPAAPTPAAPPVEPTPPPAVTPEPVAPVEPITPPTPAADESETPPTDYPVAVAVNLDTPIQAPSQPAADDQTPPASEPEHKVAEAANLDPPIKPPVEAEPLTPPPAAPETTDSEPESASSDPVQLSSPPVAEAPPADSEVTPAVSMPPPVEDTPSSDPLTSSSTIIKPASVTSINVVDADETKPSTEFPQPETSSTEPQAEEPKTDTAEAEPGTDPVFKDSGNEPETEDAIAVPDIVATMLAGEPTAPTQASSTIETTTPAITPPETATTNQTTVSDNQPAATDSSQTMTAEKSTVMDQIQDFVDNEEAQSAKDKADATEPINLPKTEAAPPKIVNPSGQSLGDPVYPDPDYIPSGTQKDSPSGTNVGGSTDNDVVTENDFMHIANKKVIEPLESYISKKPNINELLAKETAATDSQPPAPDYVAGPSVTPDQQPLPNQSTADPNNIAL